MCGRAYQTYTPEELEARYWTKKPIHSKLPKFAPNYNMSPTQEVPVILMEGGELHAKLLRWGLVPSWAKDLKSAAKYSMINAKGEEIQTKRSYKASFERRRCIVPLSGFVEWKRLDEKHKVPFAIHLKNDPIMSVAGVWEHWESKETGELIDSFTIVTTSANQFMEAIHNRMPVILDKKNEEAWLDPDNKDLNSLTQLLKPCPNNWLSAYEISTAINSPRNNRKEVLDPVS